MLAKETRKTLLLVWPLLLGLGMIMAGNGLQGTLLSLRAESNGFSFLQTGIIMSLYYAGFLGGCRLAPHMIGAVGHIRVFAAMASLASSTVLLPGLFGDFWLWGVSRIFSGLSFAGLFIVSESWLNNIAPNRLRAQVFGSYIFVLQGGLFLGQFLITLAPVAHIDLFVLVSVLVSLSLMPLTLANKPAPGYTEPESLPLRTIWATSPLVLAGVFTTGFCSGTFVSLGPFYGHIAGLDTHHIALFIASYVLGSALLPLFFGWLSDGMDRRKVIIGLAFCASAASVSIAPGGALWLLLTFIFGGSVTSVYSICVSYLNDRLEARHLVSASSTLILFNSFGACIGPVTMGLLISRAGTAFFFPVFTALFAAFMLFGIYRAFAGQKVNITQQKDFVPLPPRSGQAILEIGEGE